MQQLQLVTILHNFTLPPFEDFFVCLNLFDKFLLELGHTEFVLLRNSCAMFCLLDQPVVVYFEVCKLFECIILHARHYLEHEVPHVPLINLAFSEANLDEARWLGNEPKN
jgi:hypothetical protein